MPKVEMKLPAGYSLWERDGYWALFFKGETGEEMPPLKKFDHLPTDTELLDAIENWDAANGRARRGR